MAIDESDDDLRRTIFGRGSSPEQVRAAANELERRTLTTGAPTSGFALDQATATVDGTGGLDERSQQLESSGGSSRGPRRVRRVLVVAAVALVSAVLGGLGTAVYLDAQASRDGATVPVTASDGELVVYEVPTSGRVASVEDIDRWFRSPQDDRDVPPPSLDGFDPTSSRFIGQVGQVGDIDAAWIARGENGDYCVLIVYNSQTGASSACADATIFARDGVSVAAENATVFWNAGAIILSKTPPP